MDNFIYSEVAVSAGLLQDFSEKFQISGDLAPLKSFALLPEYLLSVTVLYGVLLSTWVTGHSYNLMIQKTFSETFGLVMVMVCFLYYNNMLCSFSNTFTKVVISVNYSFYKSILNGELAIVAKFAICFISAIFFFVSAYSLTEQKLTASEYSILLAFSMLGLLLLCNGNDLLTIYLSIELAALASYALASFKKTHCSSESGLKYFVVGSISSSFFLLGSSFLYLEANSIYFVDFNRLFEYNKSLISESINISFLDISIAFILVSLFTKLACAPFHLWALNVYEESPTSSIFYFATVTKLSTVILIIRLAFHTFFTICFVWVALFIVVGIISALMGAFGGIRQKKIKTMLAYSSTSNVGYALVALGGLTDTAIWSVFFHIIIYQSTSLCLWTLLLIARLRLKIQTCKYNKEISDLSLFKKSSLPVVFAFGTTIFSLAGIPPLLGFEPKLFILTDIVRSQNYLPAVLFILCSIVATLYYLRMAKTIYFESIDIGNVTFPILLLYSIFLSFLIHSIFYFFNDIRCFNTALEVLNLHDKNSRFTLLQENSIEKLKLIRELEESNKKIALTLKKVNNCSDEYNRNKILRLANNCRLLYQRTRELYVLEKDLQEKIFMLLMLQASTGFSFEVSTYFPEEYAATNNARRELNSVKDRLWREYPYSTGLDCNWGMNAPMDFNEYYEWLNARRTYPRDFDCNSLNCVDQIQCLKENYRDALLIEFYKQYQESVVDFQFHKVDDKGLRALKQKVKAAKDYRDYIIHLCDKSLMWGQSRDMCLPKSMWRIIMEFPLHCCNVEVPEIVQPETVSTPVEEGPAIKSKTRCEYKLKQLARCSSSPECLDPSLKCNREQWDGLRECFKKDEEKNPPQTK